MKKELGLVCWDGHVVNIMEKAKDRTILLRLLEAFLI